MNIFVFFDLNLYAFLSSEIVHEDFAATEIVNSLEDVHLRATKQHGKQKLWVH